jgi:hypothetical protein
MKLELCTNNEAIQGWCGLDWSDFDGNDYAVQMAAEDFTAALWESLEAAGYEVERAKGQRATCHGWNGANTFRWKSGPLGSFEIPTEAQKTEIATIVENCHAAAIGTWQEDYEECTR